MERISLTERVKVREKVFIDSRKNNWFGHSAY